MLSPQDMSKIRECISLCMHPRAPTETREYVIYRAAGICSSFSEVFELLDEPTPHRFTYTGPFGSSDAPYDPFVWLYSFLLMAPFKDANWRCHVFKGERSEISEIRCIKGNLDRVRLDRLSTRECTLLLVLRDFTDQILDDWQIAHDEAEAKAVREQAEAKAKAAREHASAEALSAKAKALCAKAKAVRAKATAVLAAPHNNVAETGLLPPTVCATLTPDETASDM